MFQALFQDITSQTLELSLDAASTRAHLIAHNIANADVPNYKAQRLQFEYFLQRELDRSETSAGDLTLRQTDPRHLPGHAAGGLKGTLTPYGLVYTEDRTTYRLDGNNVDIDHEMAEQAKNALMYTALTELTTRRMSALRTAISEGRR